jgi:hypothetical protein
MLCHAAFVRTDVSEEPSASFIRVTRFVELGTTQAATSNRRMLHAYADGMNLLVDNIDTTHKNTETLINASNEISLEVNKEKTEYMLVSHN